MFSVCQLYEEGERMRIAICDDEIYWVEDIRRRIEELDCREVEIEIECFTDQSELLKRAEEDRFHLIYLDIEMEGKNGIEVAGILKEHNPVCIIVFVTGYSSYVSDAFRVEAFQYLRKPIEERIFAEEFERAVKQYKRVNLVRIFKVKEGNRAFNLSEIISVESYYNSALIRTTRGTYATNYVNMRKIRKEIMDYDFLQLQSGYIVNMHYILSMRYREAELITGQILPISMTNFTKVLEKYHRFIESLE